MAKILVLYYSMYGHIETLAEAVADGARRVSGVEVTLKRAPETIPADAFAKAGGKQNQKAPIATPQELADYDGIIFGTPTRFGNMAGQMRTFLDQTGGLWASGALYGKVNAGKLYEDDRNKHLKEHGYIPCPSDGSFFTGEGVRVTEQVDDFLIKGTRKGSAKLISILEKNMGTSDHNA